jgi:curved DNA-binding protein CbpA
MFLIRYPAFYHSIRFAPYSSRVENLYDVLKVKPTASRGAIRAAYVELSKEYHPDINPNSPTANERFIQLNKAYSILIEPSSRRQYDSTLRYPLNDTYPVSHNHYRNREYSFYDGTYGNNYTRVNHGRIIGYLIILMLVATGIHTYRIHLTHQEFKKRSDEESQRNQAIYNEIREKAKSLTIKEQLDILSAKYKENISK